MGNEVVGGISALDEERDIAYASWIESLPAEDKEAGMGEMARHAFYASWEYAMDVAARCVQLLDAGYVGGPLQ